MKIGTLLDIIFPKLQYIFEYSIHAKDLYALLKKYPSIAALREKLLFSLLSKNFKDHYDMKNALFLKSYVKSSGEVSN